VVDNLSISVLADYCSVGLHEHGNGAYRHGEPSSLNTDPSQVHMPACALMAGWMEFCLQFILIPPFLPWTPVTYPNPIPPPPPPPPVSPSSEAFEYCMTRKRCISESFSLWMVTVVQAMNQSSRLCYWTEILIFNKPHF
jgi:hypothetical protein